MTLQPKTLTVFRPLEDDVIVHSMLKLQRISRNIGSSLKLLEEFALEYARLFAMLAEVTELAAEPLVGNPWQNHLLNIILETETTFTRKSEAAPFTAMGPDLKLAAARDLRCLQELFCLDAHRLLQSYAEKTLQMSAKHDDAELPGEDLPSWADLRPLPYDTRPFPQKKLQMKKNLAAAEDWAELPEALGDYFRMNGSGIFGKYRAFRWQAGPTGGGLAGIPYPDPVRLSELVGCEDQKKTVTDNTGQFVKGLPANNILLYGDRGTGKSSTVKALLHEYGDMGLRIVEVAKHDLGDFPQLLSILQLRPQRFIIFIDDLSFDDHAGDFRQLKAVLEGSLSARPANVLIYATSNRRHLVREYFSDRKDPADEIRSQDTLQEKLSLADRFGLTVTYTAPDQERYLAIVEAMVRQRNLNIPAGELRELAVRWELRYNGRSGRTARQFADWLAGEMAAGKP